MKNSKKTSSQSKKPQYQSEVTSNPSKEEFFSAIEEQLFNELHADNLLRQDHIEKILQKCRFKHHTIPEATEIVDNMLRFAILAYEMVMQEERKISSRKGCGC